MRKKFALLMGLVVLTLTVLMALERLALDRERTDGLPLRVGMTGDEVDSAFDSEQWHNYKGRQRTREEGLQYGLERDWLGESPYVVVFFDDEGRVIRWETKPPRYRRSWWGRLLYVAGMKPPPPPASPPAPWP
jgi:hypothetical protein